MSTPATSNVLGGPAKIQLDDSDVGHTNGGISCTITPENRIRNVDQYGPGGAVKIIHTGDNVRFTVPFAEWAADSLKELYNPGDDQTAAASGGTFLGIGRSAGYVYTDKNAKIVPFLSADAAKRVQFFKATPIGQVSIAFNNEADRISETEFAALIDESKDDGQLIGKLELTTS